MKWFSLFERQFEESAYADICFRGCLYVKWFSLFERQFEESAYADICFRGCLYNLNDIPWNQIQGPWFTRMWWEENNCHWRIPYHKDLAQDSTTVLQSVQSEKEGRTVWGLLWCSSTIENSKLFVNLDLNAAINIHNFFTMYPIRPGILASPKKYCKLEVVVGRKIDYKLTGSLQNAVSREV